MPIIKLSRQEMLGKVGNDLPLRSVPATPSTPCLSSSGATELHFVVSIGKEKPNPALRKLIRSHVMLGKNRGKTLPPRKKTHKESTDSSSSNLDHSLSSISQSKPSISTNNSYYPAKIPQIFGVNMSTVQFPGDVEPKVVEVVLRFSSIAKEVLFALEPCIFFERRSEQWIAPLAFDAAFMHVMIFTSQCYFDAMASGTPSSISKKALSHYLKGIRLLRERFASEDNRAKLSITTIAAIMSLVGHAMLAGDFESAVHHMEGLLKIVILRGGVASFNESPKILIEVLRCDIGIAIHRGSRPLFFNYPPHHEPCLQYPDLRSLLELESSLHTSNHPFHGINEDLSKPWNVMSEFCALINFAATSGQLISTKTFLDTMVSVMYSLIGMRFITRTKDEVIRIGLLAFSCNAFLQWKNIGMSYSHLAFMFKSILTSSASEYISPQLMIWLLTVGAISVFDVKDDVWLAPLLRNNIMLCGIESWMNMQRLLESFIWIAFVNDKPGKRVYELALATPHFSSLSSSDPSSLEYWKQH